MINKDNILFFVSYSRMSELASGTYGVVLPYRLKTNENTNEEYKNHITKIFFHEKDYDEIKKKQPLINKIFQSDPNYRTYPYKKDPLLFANILKTHDQTVNKFGTIRNKSDTIVRNSNYEKVSKVYKKARGLESSLGIIMPDAWIDAVHMPHLGVDFEHIKDIIEPLRAIPVYNMLVNVRELLGKVSLLWDENRNDGIDKRYIHGDIRPPNMMIRPTTGKMTLIDFDWLEPVNKFVRTYPFRPMYPHIPPELIVMPNVIESKFTNRGHAVAIHLLRLTTKETDEMKLSIKKEPYLVQDTSFTLTELGSAYGFHIFTYLGMLYDNEEAFKKAVEEAINGSFDDWAELARNGVVSSLRTFDGYGVAHNLLELFHLVYPGSVTNEPFQQDATPEEQAIHAMVHDVLMPLCALRLRDRKPVKELLPIADAIIAKLERKEKANNKKNSNQNNRKNGGTRNKKRSKRTRKQKK